MDTRQFHYDLPDGAIAQEAIEPRDAARLLHVQADGANPTTHDRHVAELPALLRPHDLVVVNRTRVRPARLRGAKAATGGVVEILLTGRDPARPDRWQALIRPARCVRPGTELDFGPIRGVVVAGPDTGVVTVELSALDEADVDDLLTEVGEIPLPPYFHGRLSDPERYQTIFAKTTGSAAAPTAGLHFTPRLMQELSGRGVTVAEVELEVGLDTFRPIATPEIETHRMHTERYHVPDATAMAVAQARERGSRVVAIGTTVVRTLEAAADGSGGVVPGSGATDLFIRPGYRLNVVDAVLTNFHAPGTTLVVMIAALIGPGWRDVYARAVRRGYRFLSFGDAMLIDPVHPAAARDAGGGR